MPIMQGIMAGLSLAICWIGAIFINRFVTDSGTTAVLFADMMVFSQRSMQIVIAFMLLVIIFMIYPRAQVSLKRINEVLDTEFTIPDGERETGLDGVNGEIEFKDVYLFGSYARGEANRNSDVDIYCDNDDIKPLREYCERIIGENN